MSDLQSMRQLDVQDRYEAYLQDLEHHQRYTQAAAVPLRLKAAHTLRILADLIEGKARVMVVYTEPHASAS